MFRCGGEKCEEGLTVGTEIGMSFKHPDVVISDFGSANKLGGVIPMLLPYGHYKHPPVLDVPERLDNFIRPKIHEYVEFFPNDTDEEIMEKLRTAVKTGIHLYPRQDIDTPYADLLVRLVIGGFVLDDLYDSIGDDEKMTSYSGAKKMSGMLNDVVGGVYKSASEIPSLVPALDPFRNHLFRTIELSKELIPGYTERNKWSKIEMDNGMRGSILIRYTEDGGKISYSRGGRALFGGYQNGAIQYIELIALFENIEVDEKIRFDIVFQKLKADVAIVSYALNDVYGIVRDIENKMVRDSNILTTSVDNGIPLQDAFDISLKTVIDAMSDAKISIKLLKEYYSDDEQFLNYISILEEAVDGEIYWYARITRYGETNSKIVALQ